ncbi:MAG TPA: tetratricopeptide repeat protein, partial [Bacillales bacterium]|nr:tetratricopeptide repeat protein [Bacillales bacterium]
KDFDKTASALADVEPVEDDAAHWLNYFYYFFRGIYHYDQEQYRIAMEYYLKAEPLVHKADFPEEDAELFYKMAAACHRVYAITSSISYARKALTLFKKQLNYLRCAHCENLLALNNHDIEQYKQSEMHYHNALIYAAKCEDSGLRMYLSHNFGLLYSKQNRPKKALYYLMEVFESTHSQEYQLRARNFFLLAENYFKIDQIAEAKRMLEQGVSLAKEHGIQDFYYRCDLLKAKFVEPLRFEDAYKEGISYYNDHERWEYVIEYSEELATFYRGKEDFQQSSDYFYLAMIARGKILEEREKL